MIAPANQSWMSGRLNAKKIVTLKASHASLASQPDPVIALIEDAIAAV